MTFLGFGNDANNELALLTAVNYADLAVICIARESLRNMKRSSETAGGSQGGQEEALSAFVPMST